MSKSKQNRKRKARKNQPEVSQPKAKKRFVVPVALTGILVVLLGTFSVHALASAFLSVKYRPVSLSSGSASDENVQTNFTYDGLGNVVTQNAVNPTTGNQTTRYLYEDPYDATLPTSIIYPDSSDTNSSGTDQVKIAYYLDGNIRTISDQNGTLRTFSYDHQRRLAADTVTTLGTGVDGTVRKIARTYNALGLLERLSSLDVSNNVLNEVMYTYNANQDLQRIYQSHSGAVDTNTTPYIEYEYSPLIRGRLATVTYPSGKVLTYNYDALGRVNAIQDGQQTVVSYGIDGAGRLLQVTYNEPGLSLDYVGGGMDRHARVADHAWKKNNVDVVRIKHDYDYAGNRLNRQDAVNAASSELYGYDQLNQITSLERGALNANRTEVPSPSHSESWLYDKLGNWLSYFKNGTTETRTHNAANEIQNTCVHDANGNMTVMPGLKAKYDAWNRIVEVRDSSDNLIANYEYNGANQRVKKTVNNVVTKSFFNKSWQELESVSGAELTSYVWGLRYIDDLVYRQKGAEKSYSLADPNWNIVAIADSSGAVWERYVYDGFGKRRIYDSEFDETNTSSISWDRMFSGLPLDVETNLIHCRNRYYSSSLGRFITRDPIEYRSGDANIYRYVFNSPISEQDPYGLACCGSNGVYDPDTQCCVNDEIKSIFTVCIRCDNSHCWIFSRDNSSGHEHTYGRWMVGYGGTPHSGVHTDVEKNMGRGHTHESCTDVCDFNPTIDSGYNWYNNNCATYARTEWERVSCERLSATGWWTGDHPDPLCRSIDCRNAREQRERVRQRRNELLERFGNGDYIDNGPTIFRVRQ